MIHTSTARETNLLQEQSEPSRAIVNLQERDTACSVSQEKPLFKKLSHSTYLIIRRTAIVNNKSKYLFPPDYGPGVLHAPYYFIIPLTSVKYAPLGSPFDRREKVREGKPFAQMHVVESGIRPHLSHSGVLLFNSPLDLSAWAQRSSSCHT